jgi:hypothetical protein
VHDADTPFLIAPLYNQSNSQTNSANGHANKHTESKGVDALTIISRIISDKRWSNIGFDDFDIVKNFVLLGQSAENSAAIVEHVKDWKVDTSDEKEVERKIEELQWLSVLLFIAPKPEESDEPRADFIL